MPTEEIHQTPPRGLDSPEACVCHGLRQATRALSRVYHGAIQPAGIRGPQFSILMVIARCPHPTIARVADRLTMDRTTLARNLRPLEDAGLVRMEAGTDRREHLIRLTPEGEAALEAAAPLWEAVQRRIVTELGPERARRLLSDLAEVVRIAGEG